MLNNVRDNASPCLRPVSTEKSSDSSPLNLTLHLDFCAHAFINLTNFVEIPSWVIAFHSLHRFTESYACLKSTNSRCTSMSNSWFFSTICFIV
ncbi:Uncharacterized protein FWK35_00028443 [Aphis craccivora]|uniref:Uncharacterized protein n=1 Tax=Aphis craccivora TaxID=307492 RepID=A0A6G0W1D2_APHCR|nr:Uncharacterized protein FWK35_00028443 [Aphis craccivora]